MRHANVTITVWRYFQLITRKVHRQPITIPPDPSTLGIADLLARHRMTVLLFAALLIVEPMHQQNKDNQSIVGCDG